MTTKTEGLFGKFNVSRVDGRDQPGGDKEDAVYFVLDIRHDWYAREALRKYATEALVEYPKLAIDLVTLLDEVEYARDTV